MNMKYSLSAPTLALILALSASAEFPDPPPTVTLSGPIAGVASSDRNVWMFKGIPYAAPPVGPLRWREPQPVKKWTEVLKADHFSKNCVQPVIRELLPWTQEFMLGNDVSEDCLYLNVWTSAPSSNQKLPVYVYIHGGGFMGGSGDVSMYDGEHLARRGIVVITLNYRLGLLGFLAHPELSRESPHHSSGNYGLLDQIAALQWIRDNISAFGGDPNSVTIGGQSAGAISVNLLTVSPLAKGLFCGVVAESGSTVIDIPMPKLPEAQAGGATFAVFHGAKSLRDLRQMSWQDLTAPKPGNTDSSGGPRFGPVIDGWFLPATPAQIIAQGKQNDVPIITGWNADDYFGRPADAKKFTEQAVQRYGSFAKEFLQLYPAGSDAEALSSYKEASRDRNRVAMYLWASARNRTSKTPAFLYFFAQAVPWPEHPEFGAFHTGEVPYIFDNLDHLSRPWNEDDKYVAQIFSSYLVNFVRAQVPSGPGVPLWPALDLHQKVVMQIASKAALIPLAPFVKENFWVRFFASPEGKKLPFL